MKYSIFIILLLTISCNEQDKIKAPEYLDIEGQGLTTKEKIQSMHLTNEGVIFIGGQNEFLSNVAVIYKSTDEGKSWSSCYTGNGKIGKISSSSSENLFALKYPNHSDNESKYEFLSSRNSGTTWENIPFPGAKIWNYQIVNDSCYIMFVKDYKRSEAMYITYNSGTDWHFFDLLERNDLINYSSVKVRGNVIHCLYNTQFHKDSMKVFSFDLLSKELKKYNVPIELEHPDIYLPASGGVKLIEKLDATIS